MWEDANSIFRLSTSEAWTKKASDITKQPPSRKLTSLRTPDLISSRNPTFDEMSEYPVGCFSVSALLHVLNLGLLSVC